MKKALYVVLSIVSIVPIQSLSLSDNEFENIREAIQNKDGDRFIELLRILGSENRQSLDNENEENFEDKDESSYYPDYSDYYSYYTYYPDYYIDEGAEENLSEEGDLIHCFDDESEQCFNDEKDQAFDNEEQSLGYLGHYVDYSDQGAEENLSEESDLIPLLQRLMQEGVDLKTNIKFTDENGEIFLFNPLDVLLHLSVLDDSLQEVKFLTENGANINYVDPIEGATALHWAAENDHLLIVEYLLNNGANKNIKNFKGYLPLDLAKSEKMKRLLRS